MAGPRYLKAGVVPIAATVTVALAILRTVHVLVPTWWAVGLPGLVVVLAYVQARVDYWAAERAANRREGGV